MIWSMNDFTYLYYIPFLPDIDDCVDNECVDGHCKDGINSYTCDCTGTGFRGDRCEIGTLLNPYILYVNTLTLHKHICFFKFIIFKKNYITQFMCLTIFYRPFYKIDCISRH